MGLRATKTLYVENSDGSEDDDVLKYVGKHRKLDCESYDLCLDVAVLLGWNGFSCSRCEGEGPDEVLLGCAHQMMEKWLAGEVDPFRLDYKPILYREYFVSL